MASKVPVLLLAGMFLTMINQAEAQSLPALANVSANADKQAALVNEGNGATAVIAGSSPLSGAAMAISDTGYDLATHHMFVVDVSNNKLLTINMVDGSIVASPTLTLPAGALAVSDLEWNASTSTLLGIVTITGGDKQLATFNTSTGSASLVGAGGIEGGNVGTFSQPFDLDAAGQRYYMVGSAPGGDKLYAINTATGALADSVLLAGKLPAGATTIFGLEYDPGEAKLYAIVGLAGGAKQLGSINTTSGATFGDITLIGAGGIGGGGSISLAGYEALDATGNLYYTKGSIGGVETLFEIDTATGVAVQKTLSFGAGINDVRGMELDTALSTTPPSIAKAFSPTSIAVGGLSTLTFTVTNPNAGTALTGVAFTDSFPAGLSVAATPNATTTGCGAPVFAPAAGNTSVSLTGGTIAASGTCTVTVAITATTTGSKVNTTGNVTSTNGGAGNTGTDTLTVNAAPSIAKAFAPTSIAVGGISTLTFTVTNPNAGSALTGVGFTDGFPAGMSVATTPNATTTGCGAPVFAPAAGNTSVSFTGGTVAASGTCTVTVDVTATTSGSKGNTTGNVTSTNGGTGNTGTATLTVIAAPAIAKSFTPTSIAVGGVSTMTFTVTNPNAGTALTGVAFTDSFPAGVSVAATPNATTTGCGAPVFAPAAGNTTVSFTGGTIAASGTCTVTVDVAATTEGSKVNTTGNVSSTNGGTGNTGTATLTVISPPAIVKSFAPAAIAVGGLSTMTFTVTNPNTGSALTGVAFTDNFPAGVSVAATPNTTTTGCGAPLFTPAAGSTSLSFIGGTIVASGTCTVTVDVTATTAGSKVNTTSPVSSGNAGAGNTGTATLTVSTAPAIAKSFAPTSIAVGGVSTLTFTVTNPNAGTALTGVAFTDSFPAGVSVAPTPNATTTGCGAPVFAPAAGNATVSFTSGTIAASGTCTVTVDVTGSSAGSKVNTTGNVTSTNGGTGNTGTATLTVIAAPGISKAFAPSLIPASGLSTLTFTVTNPNAGSALTGAAFTDNFPAGLSVAATPNATTTGCGAPAFAPVAGNTSVSFTGGTIAAGGTCTVTVDVTASSAGSKVNTTGNVTSTNGGTGNTGTATLTVGPTIPTMSTWGLILVGLLLAVVATLRGGA